MRVKLQTLSANTLPPFNSFLPPPAITQIMMIARQVNEREKVKLKYKFSFSINNEAHSEMGEIDNLFENESKESKA